MQTSNPFPGMNPFLEGSWPDVHTRLIGYISESLGEELPDDLTARAEEEIIVGTEESAHRYRADVAVSEVWPVGLPDVWQPESSEAGAVAVAEPQIIELEHPPARWIEIRNIDGRLITVIEVLSPANKLEPGRNIYLQKQQDYLFSGVSLVEIDLLRVGRPPFLEDFPSLLKPVTGTHYLVATTRAMRPYRREIYDCPLRQRLPAVRVPLRATDKDVPLDLQPMIDRVYRTGRYWQNSRRDVPAPALSPDDAAWVEEQLRQAGLR